MREILNFIAEGFVLDAKPTFRVQSSYGMEQMSQLGLRSIPTKKRRGSQPHNKEEKGVFDLIEGLTPVEAGALEDFKQTMIQEVIPEIIRVVERRHRRWQLKYGGGDV